MNVRFELNFNGNLIDVTDYLIDGSVYKSDHDITFGGLPVFDGYKIFHEVVKYDDILNYYVDISDMDIYDVVSHCINKKECDLDYRLIGVEAFDINEIVDDIKGIIPEDRLGEIYALVFYNNDENKVLLVFVDDPTDLVDFLNNCKDIKAIVQVGDLEFEIDISDTYEIYDKTGWYVPWLIVNIYNHQGTFKDEKYRISISVIEDMLYAGNITEHLERFEEDLRALLKKYNLKAKVFNEATGNEMTVK